MTNAKDNIRVGRIIMVYSEQKHGWIAPGGRVIRNPLKSQRLAEELNGKKVAA